VCDTMVEARDEGRWSFIAGASTRNMKIERLWREVLRCVCHLFYCFLHNGGYRLA